MTAVRRIIFLLLCCQVLPLAGLAQDEKAEPSLELQMNVDEAGRVVPSSAFAPEGPDSSSSATPSDDAAAQPMPRPGPLPQKRHDGLTVPAIALIAGGALLLGGAIVVLMRRARFENAFGRTFPIPPRTVQPRLGAPRTGGQGAVIRFKDPPEK